MFSIGKSKGTEPFLRHKGDVNEIARAKADRPRELDKSKFGINYGNIDWRKEDAYSRTT